MSKYIKTIPLSSIERIAIVQGGGRLISQVKRDTGCDYAMNAGFYGGNGKPTHHLKADGKVLARAPWGCWGFAWNNGADIRMEALPADTRLNYIAGVELLSPMVSDTGSIPYDPKGELGGTRGRTAIAHTGDKLLLYCSGDGTRDAATLEEVQEELRRLGAETAIYVDGGGSSQCDFGGGETIRSSRKVYSYLCVWLKPQKEEDKPVDGIIAKYMSKNDCYTGGRTIKPKGIMVHSTAAPGVMVEALRSQWDKPGVDKAVHAMVDDKGVLQTLPWDRRGWHAGTGTSGRSANDTHIAFEVCEPQECRLLPIEWAPLKRGSTGWAVQRLQMELKARGYDPKGVDGSFGPGCEAALKACQRALGLTADGSCGPATLAALAKRTGSYLAYTPTETETYFRAVWGHAVALCAKLCKEYGLDPLKDILCHSEGYKAGIASNHADVMHWWPQHGESMDSFRAAVQAAVAGNPATDYRAKVQERFGLDPATVDYLAAYTYGADLLRKLATAK